jgi:hypothetical protein
MEGGCKRGEAKLGSSAESGDTLLLGLGAMGHNVADISRPAI